MAGGGDVLCALLVVGPALLKGEGWRNATRLPLCLPPSLRRLSTKPRCKQTRVLNGADLWREDRTGGGRIGGILFVSGLLTRTGPTARVLNRWRHWEKG